MGRIGGVEGVDDVGEFEVVMSEGRILSHNNIGGYPRERISWHQ